MPFRKIDPNNHTSKGLQTFEEYENKIIDLSRRNRLLKFPRNAKSVIFSVSLQEFIAACGPLTDFTIEFNHRTLLNPDTDEVKQKNLLVAEKALIATNPEGEQLLKLFNKLRLETRRNFEEHGLHTLFLTIGKIKWKETGSSTTSPDSLTTDYDYNAPLLLIPITIEEKKSPKTTIIRPYLEMGDIMANNVLSLLLEKKYNAPRLVLPTVVEQDWLSVYNHLQQQLKELFASLKLPFIIQDELQIGQYSFHEQQIYEDLHSHKTDIMAHEFINALCSNSQLEHHETNHDDNPDALLTPQDDFNVMEADRSQLQVIAQAIEGNNLNVQGPPGTGKSQTIVNLISNLIARNKTVLVVCEKNVALQVVLDRLKSVGLDKLCLPLFHYNADKKSFAKTVLEDRETILRSLVDKKIENTVALEQRKKIIDTLRSYARALEQVAQPLGKSVYWVHGEWAQQEHLASNDIPIIWKGGNPLSITFDEYNRIMGLLDQMGPYYNVPLRAEYDHWKNVKRINMPPDFTNQLKHELERIKKSATSLEPLFSTDWTIEKLLLFKDIPTASTLTTIPGWNERTTLQALAIELAKLNEMTIFSVYAQQELEKYGINLETVPHETLKTISIFTTKYATILRHLNWGYYQDKNSIKNLCSGAVPQTHADYRSLATLITNYQHVQHNLKTSLATFNERHSPNSPIGQHQISGMLSDCLFFNACLQENKLEHIAPELYKNAVETAPALNQINESLKRLNELFENTQSIQPLTLLTVPAFIEQLESLKADHQGLHDWVQYRYYADQLKDYTWFLTATSATISNNPAALFAQSLWNAWLEAYYAQNNELKYFRKDTHKRMIADFNALEKDILSINSERIIQKYAFKFKNEGRFRSLEDTELLRQSQFKSRHKPIRKLVQETGKRLLDYKPCWMMSPLTLSSYIPYGSLDFDVVIFDEASQMKVEHSLGAIARVKQVIIFGDENQLSPTSFFEVHNENEQEDDEIINDYESVLHATKEILPGSDYLLSHHYRSKYEDLIMFSNHHIYNNRLITFPNADKSQSALQFEWVKNGVFDGGKGGSSKNFIEAERVAQLCVKVALAGPAKSLGVISFSKSQEDAIRDALQDYFKNNSESPAKALLDESNESSAPFFIKNLESVQGDERDTIILSVGYGPNKLGKISNHFGPINHQDGYRRLNVAVTRAREQIICVSSLQASDITGTSRGATLLHDYLDYAQNGIASLKARSAHTGHKGATTQSTFEDAVERELQARGYTVHRNIGASTFKIDLAIVDPEDSSKYILGIECDGPSYHSGYSARMNDRMRQQILERLGWKIFRIWSQHWITHKQETLDEIEKILHNKIN